MKKIQVILLLVGTLMSASCRHFAENGKVTEREVALSTLPQIIDNTKMEDEIVSNDQKLLPSPPKQDPGQPKQQTQENLDWDKKIIRNADLSVEVKKYKDYYEKIKGSIKRNVAYMADEEETQSGYKIENNITIEVPVTHFTELVEALTSGDDKLLEKKIGSEDVTMDYVDTRSRLESKKAVLQRYMDLLKQAKNMKEILEVQEQINDIQEEIEAGKGRMNYLSHSAAYSTIKLNFYQVLDATVQPDETPGFWAKLVSSVKIGWDGLSEVVLGFVSIWPLLILVAMVWGLLRKYFGKKSHKVLSNESQAELT